MVGNFSEGAVKYSINGAGQATMYKMVAQSVILYGIKSWVVTGDMLKALEGFRHRAA